MHVQVPAERVAGTLAAIGTELAARAAPVREVLAVGFGHGVIDRSMAAPSPRTSMLRSDIAWRGLTIVLVDGAMGFNGSPSWANG